MGLQMVGDTVKDNCSRLDSLSSREASLDSKRNKLDVYKTSSLSSRNSAVATYQLKLILIELYGPILDIISGDLEIVFI